MTKTLFLPYWIKIAQPWKYGPMIKPYCSENWNELMCTPQRKSQWSNNHWEIPHGSSSTIVFFSPFVGVVWSRKGIKLFLAITRPCKPLMAYVQTHKKLKLGGKKNGHTMFLCLYWLAGRRNFMVNIWFFGNTTAPPTGLSGSHTLDRRALRVQAQLYIGRCLSK